jgi:hypothetical protein
MEQNDAELWEDLIQFTLSRPPFIPILLEKAGTSIDPIAFLQRIPNGPVIPGLRDACLKIIHDFHLQVILPQPHFSFCNYIAPVLMWERCR